MSLNNAINEVPLHSLSQIIKETTSILVKHLPMQWFITHIQTDFRYLPWDPLFTTPKSPSPNYLYKFYFEKHVLFALKKCFEWESDRYCSYKKTIWVHCLFKAFKAFSNTWIVMKQLFRSSFIPHETRVCYGSNH